MSIETLRIERSECTLHMHVRTLVWVCMGTPCEIRTHVYAVKERRPRPLDEGGYMGLKNWGIRSRSWNRTNIYGVWTHEVTITLSYFYGCLSGARDGIWTRNHRRDRSGLYQLSYSSTVKQL